MKKVALFIVVVLSTNAWSDGDLRSAVQNPISSMISLPFKLNLDYGADNGDATILNIQPVIPVTVGDWNLVNRAIIPVAHVDGAIQGPGNPSPQPDSGSASGLGDINYTLFFSPVKYDKVIWGAGPSLTMKTATNDVLGSGKWSGGLSAVALTQPGWGTMGVLGRQLWSFAGDSDRKDVNQFLLEPFVNYNLKNGWFLITDMIITANWDAPSSQRWTVPLGGGAHLGVWKQDHVRYKGALARLSINLTFYGTGDNQVSESDGMDFNADGWYLLQEAKFRLNDSDWFIGGRLEYTAVDIGFDQGIDPPGVADDNLNQTQTLGLGPILSYDSHDNLFSPNRGIYAAGRDRSAFQDVN